ncbi:2,3-bisphosphoglycerate-independent phosphoglycerate mutase [Candidatus Falkowbacteria bacterium]|nr:2,3-bisphosphoglycerate-independent phosphoglycerate mutase [Candidatus Falkowbacteria bacterium]
MPKQEKLNKPKKNISPMILVILDGWGIAQASKGNAVALSKTPVMDSLIKNYPSAKIYAHGKHVGLPPLQSGNSEAGHMNIGAGRVVEQDAVKISKSINDGTFFKNASFVEAVRHAEKNKSRIHLMGMISNGMSAHSDPDHLLALLSFLRIRKVKEVYSSLKLIVDIQKAFKNGEAIATVVGRFYAMDRKKTWDRTKKSYDALVNGVGRKSVSAQAAITESYNRGESDEFIEPYIITKNGKPLPRIADGDSVIFFNLRSDRARQLAKVFVQKDFCGLNATSCFSKKRSLKDLLFVAMTDFGPDLEGIITAFPSGDLKQTLPMQLLNLKQLYIAETEKYAHVTYFFNGGYAQAVAGEARRVIPSPNVRSYDATPAMSSGDLAKEILNNLAKRKYDFTVLNFAAPDMIGHTGNLAVGIKCCHEVDKYLGKIIEAYLRAGGTVIVTADHGNIEEMINLKTGEIDTEHSTNQVPFILVNKDMRNKVKLKSDGALSDIAPTILELLNLKKPKEMSGQSLIK